MSSSLVARGKSAGNAALLPSLHTMVHPGATVLLAAEPNAAHALHLLALQLLKVRPSQRADASTFTDAVFAVPPCSANWPRRLRTS